jgi:hypothetical protein
MRFRSRLQVEKLRQLEAAGKVPAGTVERGLADTPRADRLPKRTGAPAARPRKSNRAPPRLSVSREARRRGR